MGVTWDHPRSCGKDGFNMLKETANLGSPPLVRERRHELRMLCTGRRITPARAGKTQSDRKGSGVFQDPPRSCGKDLSFDSGHVSLPGSPPLVRERLVDALGTVDRGGITPARAGKTGWALETCKACQDHPRSCGKDERGGVGL